VSRDLFLDALEAFERMAGRAEVSDAWDAPSALEGYKVGALVGHVYSSTSAVERYLDQDPPAEGPPEPGVTYYAGLSSPTGADALHAGIRERGKRQAERGAAALVADLRALAERLSTRLSSEPAGRLVEPFGNGVLLLDEYLETRVVELVVHHDDVAVSVGVQPQVPETCVRLAVNHLLGVARHRHGDLALLRALTRRERDDAAALRVF